jgi:preprotein translocase subunit YajC
MDTKTLVVGQEVWMKSGRYFYMGRVVEVTPSGVEVKSGVQMFHFGSDGKGRNSEGSHDYGPWHIDDMPFMERVALWEEEAKKFCKTLVVGQEVWVQSGIYCGEGGKVVKVTPLHVYVQSGATSMRFDRDGKSCDGEGTCEGGPWHIRGTPPGVGWNVTI